MGFRLLPKSVTVNDLERRNGDCHASFYRIRQFFRAHYVKVVEDTPTISAAEYLLRYSCKCKSDFTMMKFL